MTQSQEEAFTAMEESRTRRTWSEVYHMFHPLNPTPDGKSDSMSNSL